MVTIDPLSIALQGIYGGSNPLNMILNGWNVEVVIEEPEPAPLPLPNVSPRPVYYAGMGVGGGVSTNKIYRQPQKVKIVTVTCEKDGVVIKKSKKFKDINVSIDNIVVEIVETKKKPRINIKLTK